MSEKKKKKRLDGKLKLIVVKCLARFMSPTEVVEFLEEDFDVEGITRQAIEKYDPTKFNGQGLSEDLKQIFWATRQEFISDLDSIDGAHQSFRLRELSQLYRKAKEDGKDVIAAQFLEQMAKERGGLYTNKRVLKVDDKRKALADILGVNPEQLPTKESIH